MFLYKTQVIVIFFFLSYYVVSQKINNKHHFFFIIFKNNKNIFIGSIDSLLMSWVGKYLGGGETQADI